jgi:hypothetical protein
MAFTSKDRQRIIDEYLNETGANLFVPSEFVDWLAERPDHEAFPLFYGRTDAEAAREFRIAAARRMANGLRIVARVSDTKGTVVSVSVREFPAFVSPVSQRGQGGGYQPFDPKDAGQLDELRRQGAAAMQSWLNRYRGAFEAAGFDLAPMEKIAAAEAARVALSA